MKTEVETDIITRFEVIDTMRRYGKWPCRIRLSVQDEGRTLKVFVSEPSVFDAKQETEK